MRANPKRPRPWVVLVQAIVFAGISIAAILVNVGVVALAAPLPDPLPCTSCFIGQLKLADNPNDKSQKTKILGEDLYFVDPDKLVWKAGAGDVTDGASIPKLFQSIVGGPWEPDYLPAAVMHDHYTDKDTGHRVRPWQDADRMFYQAMLVNHTDAIKAKTMYYAVYAFGPHWGYLAKGVPCGKNCIFAIPTGIAYQSSDYGMDHADELTEVQSTIAQSELRGTPLSLDEVSALATKKHADNVFFTSDVTQ